MRIKPYMANIHYDHSADLGSDHTLPIQDIELVAELSYSISGQFWYTFNHFKSYSEQAGRLCYAQVVFQVQDIEGHAINPLDGGRLVYTLDDGSEWTLHYQAADRLWYEASRFQRKKDVHGNYMFSTSLKDIPAGLNQSGKVTIQLKEAAGTLVSEAAVLFLPSSITLEDYHTMLADLFRIYLGLLQDRHTPVQLQLQHKTSLEWLKWTVESLEGPLRQISNHPYAKVSWRMAVEPHSFGKTERFHPSTMIHTELFQGQNKIRKFMSYEDSNVYENRIIKQFLQSLLLIAELHRRDNVYRSDLASINAEMELIHNKSRVSKGQLNQSSIMAEQKITDLDHEIQLERDNLRKCLEEHSVSPNKIPNETLEIELEFVVNPPVKETNAFFNGGKLVTIYQTKGWSKNGERGGVWDLDFSCYERLDGESQISLKGRKLSIVNASSRLRDHLLLFQAIRGCEEEKTRMVIRGKVKNPSICEFTDDIFARTEKDHKRHDFEFVQIDEIQMNNSLIRAETDESTVIQQLVESLHITGSRLSKLTDLKMQHQFRYSAAKQMMALQKQVELCSEEQASYREISRSVKELLQLPFLQYIESDSNEWLQPTQLFMHDPYYQLIWNVLKINEFVPSPSVLPNSQPNSVQVKNVNEIYELWCFTKMAEILNKSLKWHIRGDSLIHYLEVFLAGKKQQSLNGFTLPLQHGDLHLEMTYNPEIVLKKGNSLRPDYRFQFKNAEETDSMPVYLDAKYRNYREDGEAQWIKDIQDVAIEKYLRLDPANWQDRAAASFILHCDYMYGQTFELTGENYSATYHPLFRSRAASGFGDDKSGHRFGSVYLVPQSQHSIRNWFRMILEYHLDNYKTCWNCGETEHIEITKTFTAGNYPKFYFECKSCNEFWVKVHCKNGHRLIKHTNNYHRQWRTSQQYPWYVTCPICFDGEGEDNNTY